MIRHHRSSAAGQPRQADPPAWSIQEQSALTGIAKTCRPAAHEIATYLTASPRPDWPDRLVRTYLAANPGDGDASCDERRDVALTIVEFKTAGQPGVDVCLRNLRDPHLADHEGDWDEPVSAAQVRWVCVRAVVECGTAAQVVEGMPAMVKETADPTDDNLAWNTALIASSLERFTGTERRAITAAVHQTIPGPVAQVLTTRQFVAGRFLQSLGDDHPAALAWVKAQITGLLPPRADDTPVPEEGRVPGLLSWCESQIDQGKRDVVSDQAFPTLMAIAAGGSVPTANAFGSDPEISGADRERAARLVGLIAGRRS